MIHPLKNYITLYTLSLLYSITYKRFIWTDSQKGTADGPYRGSLDIFINFRSIKNLESDQQETWTLKPV